MIILSYILLLRCLVRIIHLVRLMLTVSTCTSVLARMPLYVCAVIRMGVAGELIAARYHLVTMVIIQPGRCHGYHTSPAVVRNILHFAFNFLSMIYFLETAHQYNALQIRMNNLFICVSMHLPFLCNSMLLVPGTKNSISQCNHRFSMSNIFYFFKDHLRTFSSCSNDADKFYRLLYLRFFLNKQNPSGTVGLYSRCRLG